MKLISFCVHRPIFTSMMALLVLVLGVVALRGTAVDLLPEIEAPQINVSTSYEDAAPEDVEESVTRPLEQALSAINGVEEVRSTSTEGESSISVTFVWGTDLEAATSDVRDRLDRTFPRLPDDVDRPVLRKFDSAAMPVMMLAFFSEMPLIHAREYVEDTLSYRFERLPGVASVTVVGGPAREIHVDISLERIRSLGLSLGSLRSLLLQHNVNLPGGTLREGNLNVRLRIPGSFSSIQEIRDTVLFYRNGAPVRLGSVAEILDTTEKREQVNRVNSRESVQLMVYKQSGGNTLAVADAVREEMEKINLDIPQGKFVTLFDTSDYIRDSLRNLAMAAMGGGILALGVLLFFLNSLPATLVVATAIPVSVTACFGLMYFSGFSLNVMSLGGLALGIGMLLDNAIVVLENISHRLERKVPPFQAALEGAQEVASAVLAGTLTTVVVFLPLLFVGGMSGMLFREFSLVVAFSLFCSLGVALTVIPMLSSRCVHPEEIHAGFAPFRLLGRTSSFVLRQVGKGYERLLRGALQHRGITLAFTLFLFVGVLLLGPFLGTELMPATDESEVRVYFSMAPGTHVDTMERTVEKIEKILQKSVPELRILQVRTGGWRASHEGTFRLKLLPRKERSRSSQEIALALGKELRKIPGTICRPRVSSSIMGRILGGSGENTVDIDIRGYDLDTAYALAKEIRRRGEILPGVTDVELSREESLPEYSVVVDRQKAGSLGFSVEDVAEALRILIAGKVAGTYSVKGNEYDILVQGQSAENYSFEEILDFPLRNAEGVSVKLGNMAFLKTSWGPVAIERKDRERVLTVSVAAPERPQGDLVAELRQTLAEIPLPEGFALQFSGGYEKQQESFRELLFSFLLALLLVYMVMACQFESLKDPLVVMFSVPLAAIGVIPMLFFTNTTLNLQSFIGCIMLAGIVVNNAILLVDQANRLQRDEGMPPLEAARESGIRRLRPILMTALTTCLGLLPLALALGDGGEAQAPMARAVIGGLGGATLITLIFIPALYSLVEEWHGRRKTR
ncbi:MAG TPA: efflux RND transporter permease subunit [Synergistaceae bacterium]|nr:efflux RND transporter permease subunit [Synergistaceae bacterium]HPQ37409.1 efflux RND transporter permease subunit [Synergistaceae bacterium]